ncbi:DUF7269 family protein [Halobellus sp. GM3]|uniref:DUF7269 family protein n=1 Tax=Halobellus sp. GM3 TaxID=3458410 RepID=UPI00403DFC37
MSDAVATDGADVATEADATKGADPVAAGETNTASTEETDTAEPEEIDAVRVGLAVAGLIGLVAAFGGFAVGPLEAAVATAETALGSDYLLAAGLGGVALALGTWAFASGAGRPRQATMPEVERSTPVSVPGEDFDRKLSGWRGRVPLLGSSVRESVRRRLRGVAVRTIAAKAGCSRAEAERRVAEGTWTDDPIAAAFLSASSEPPPLADRAAALRRGGGWLRFAARRTLDALEERRERGIGRREQSGERRGSEDDSRRPRSDRREVGIDQRGTASGRREPEGGRRSVENERYAVGSDQ